MSNSLKGHDRLLRRMLLASQQFQKQMADLTGLNLTDFALLGVLESAGAPMSAGALAQAADLTSGAATTAIDRLEKAGIVQRQRSEQDRRAVLVALQQPNARQLLELVEPLAAARRQLWEEFTEAERETIARFLTRSIAFAETHRFPGKADAG